MEAYQPSYHRKLPPKLLASTSTNREAYGEWCFATCACKLFNLFVNKLGFYKHTPEPGINTAQVNRNSQVCTPTSSYARTHTMLRYDPVLLHLGPAYVLSAQKDSKNGVVINAKEHCLAGSFEF